MRIPKHIGIIPDGNRRWALNKGMKKEEGYDNGISPGMVLYRMCSEMGVREMTVYGFTVDNTKRAAIQCKAFQSACIKAVEELSKEDAELLVLGNAASAMFPDCLKPYTKRRRFGAGGMKVNFLINYSWEWDLGFQNGIIGPSLRTAEVSRIDLVIRWGGCRRLSGFLPVQSVYSDMFVVDEYWPDFKPGHLEDAIAWYSGQDVTLGG